MTSREHPAVAELADDQPDPVSARRQVEAAGESQPALPQAPFYVLQIEAQPLGQQIVDRIVGAKAVRLEVELELSGGALAEQVVGVEVDQKGDPRAGARVPRGRQDEGIGPHAQIWVVAGHQAGLVHAPLDLRQVRFG